MSAHIALIHQAKELTSLPASPFFICLPLQHTMADLLRTLAYPSDATERPAKEPCKLVLFRETQILRKGFLAGLR